MTVFATEPELRRRLPDPELSERSAEEGEVRVVPDAWADERRRAKRASEKGRPDRLIGHLMVDSRPMCIGSGRMAALEACRVCDLPVEAMVAVAAVVVARVAAEEEREEVISGR